MSESTGNETPAEKVERRRLLKYLGGGVAGVALASAIGASAYFSSQAEVASLSSKVKSLNSDLGRAQDLNSDLQKRLASSEAEKASILSSLEKTSRDYLYIFGADDTTLVDPRVDEIVVKFPYKLEGTISRDGALDKQGRLWAVDTNTRTGRILVYDKITLKVSNTIDIAHDTKKYYPGFSWFRRISPAGDYFYVTPRPGPDFPTKDYKDGPIYIYNTTTLQLAKQVEGVSSNNLGWPCDVDVSPDSRVAGVVNLIDGSVILLDGRGLERTGLVKLHEGSRSSMLTFSPDGKTILIENAPPIAWFNANSPYDGDFSLSFVNVAEGKEIKFLTFDRKNDNLMPSISAFSPDGKYLFEKHRKAISIVDMASLSVVKTFEIATAGYPVVSSDSKKLYLADTEKNKLLIMNLQTLQFEKEIPLNKPTFPVIIKAKQ